MRGAVLLLALAVTVALPAGAQGLFVADQLASDVEQFDPRTGESAGSFGETGPVTNSLRAMAFHPGTRNLLLTNRSGGIQEFDGESGELLGSFGDTDGQLTLPSDLAFHPATGDLFVADLADFSYPTVWVFDGETGAFRGSFGAVADELFGALDIYIAFHPDTGNLLVSGARFDGMGSDFGVWEFDGVAGDFVGPFGGTVETGVTGPLAIAPGSGDLLISNNTASPIRNDLRRFDRTGQPLWTDPEAPSFGDSFEHLGMGGPLTFHPTTGDLLVVDRQHNDVRRFDPLTGGFLGVFATTGDPASPIDLAFQPPDPAPDLVVEKTGPSTTVIGRAQVLTYVITVTNTGAATATPRELIESLPPELSFVSATRTRSTLAGAVAKEPLPCNTDPLVGLVCPLEALEPSQSVRIEIDVQVDPTTPIDTRIENVASVVGPQAEPNLLNNIDSAITTVVPLTVPAPDLAGLTPAEAATVLAAGGLGLGRVVRVFHAAPAGQIVSQSAPPGSAVPVGSTLDARVSVGPGVPALWGRLPTNDASDVGDNRWVADWEIARWIDQSFEDGSRGDGTVDSNIIFLATICYGANFLNNFDGPTGSIEGGVLLDSISFTNTTGLTINLPGQTGAYGGAGDDMVDAASPGATAQEVNQAGVDGAFTGTVNSGDDAYAVDEKPQINGAPFRTFGGSTSTHILIWAGKPEDADVLMMNAILQRWLGQPNTTIHILSGFRPAISWTLQGTPVTEGPATRRNLRQAIQDIGALMDDGPDEQFIFFALDHGNLKNARVLPPPTPPRAGSGGRFGAANATALQVIPIADVVLEIAATQPDAQPALSVALARELEPGESFDFAFDVNGCALGTLADVAETRRLMSLPDGVTSFEYLFEVPRSCLVPPSSGADPAQPTAIDQVVGLSNGTGNDVQLDWLALSVGEIVLAAPEPDGALLAAAVLLSLVTIRRSRRQRDPRARRSLPSASPRLRRDAGDGEPAAGGSRRSSAA